MLIGEVQIARHHDEIITPEIQVDIQQLPTNLVILNIGLGREVPTGAAEILELRNLAPPKGQIPNDVFWVDENGENIGNRVNISKDEYGRLAVSGANLLSTLNSSLDEAIVGMRARTTIKAQITQISNQTGELDWSDFSISVKGWAMPSVATGKFELLPVKLDDEPENGAYPCGQLVLNFPDDIAFAADKDLKFSVEIDNNFDDGDLPVFLSPTQNLKIPVEISESEKTETTQKIEVTIREPSRLLEAGSLVLDLFANAQILHLRQGRMRLVKPLTTWEYGVSVKIAWISSSGNLEAYWEIDPAHATLSAQSDIRNWVRFSHEASSEKIYEEGCEEEYLLDKMLVVSIPDKIGRNEVIYIDDLIAKITTNSLAENEQILLDVLLSDNSGAQITSSIATFKATSRANRREYGIPDEINISLAELGFEPGLRKYLNKKSNKGKLPESICCTISLKNDNTTDAIEQTGLSWLPDFKFNIAFHYEIRRWPICIDLGMSATSVWVEDPSDIDGQKPYKTIRVNAVRLGDMHKLVDSNHDEVELTRIGANSVNYLLPSHIGLGSKNNLRTRYRALTLGDLNMVVNSDAAIFARLSSMQRSYDISVPFPSSASMADQAGSIVFNLKQLIADAELRCKPGDSFVYLPENASEITHTTVANTIALLTDYLDELFRLYVSRHLYEMDVFQLGQTGHEYMANPQLIITHPAGIGDQQRRIYHLAATALLKRLYSVSIQKIEDTSLSRFDYLSPVLIPESVASARFMMAQLDHSKSWAKLGLDKQVTFLSVDIGAGTYDVSILKVTLRNKQLGTFSVLRNFGISIAGQNLDQSITYRIAKILCQLFDNSKVTETFGHLDAGCQNIVHKGGKPTDGNNRTYFWLKKKIQIAKANLSRSLANEVAIKGQYGWDDGIETLNIVLYDSFADDGILTAVSENADAIEKHFEIYGLKICLALEAPSDIDDDSGPIHGVRVVLKLGPDVFSEIKPEWQGDQISPAKLIDIMGRILPEMAIEAAREMRPDDPIIVAVTGRTSLWPLLYSNIEQTIRNCSKLIPVKMVRNGPLTPDEMKCAVVEGASMIVRQKMTKHLTPQYQNPVSIVELKTALGARASIDTFSQKFEVSTIRYISSNSVIDEHSNNSRQFEYEVSNEYQYARALPHLNEDRIEAFNSVIDYHGIYEPLHGGKIVQPTAYTSDEYHLKISVLSDEGPNTMFDVEKPNGVRQRYKVDHDNIYLIGNN